MLTHFLNANSDILSHSGKDNISRTYFINVGRDYPGRLAHIVEQNRAMDIVAIDFEGTASGLRIVTIEKAGGAYREALLRRKGRGPVSCGKEIRRYGKEKKLSHTEDFLETLGNRYLREELTVQTYPTRVFRHQELYEKAVSAKGLTVEGAVVDHILRLSVAAYNPTDEFIPRALDYFRKARINLERCYYDLFEREKSRVGVFSFYVKELDRDYREYERELGDKLGGTWGAEDLAVTTLDSRIEAVIRRISSSNREKLTENLEELNSLCRRNREPGEELCNFYLNSVTDFMAAAELTGLDKSPELLGSASPVRKIR